MLLCLRLDLDHFQFKRGKRIMICGFPIRTNSGHLGRPLKWERKKKTMINKKSATISVDCSNMNHLNKLNHIGWVVSDCLECPWVCRLVALPPELSKLLRPIPAPPYLVQHTSINVSFHLDIIAPSDRKLPTQTPEHSTRLNYQTHKAKPILTAGS